MFSSVVGCGKEEGKVEPSGRGEPEQRRAGLSQAKWRLARLFRCSLWVNLYPAVRQKGLSVAAGLGFLCLTVVGHLAGCRAPGSLVLFPEQVSRCYTVKVRRTPWLFAYCLSLFSQGPSDLIVTSFPSLSVPPLNSWLPNRIVGCFLKGNT